MQDVVVEGPQAPAVPAAPPSPEAPPAIATVEGVPGTMVSPRAVLQAKEQQREVLGQQMSRLLNRRENVSEQLQSPMLGPAEKSALEQHYVALNGRIIEMEKALQQADAEWAAAAGVPGATLQRHRDGGDDGPPEEMLVIGAAFTGISMVILSIAWARRLWKGGGKVIAQIPAAFENRFTRLEQSLDAVAIEIERVSEGQRFLTRVFADQNPRAVGAGVAQPVESGAGDRVPESFRRT